MRAGHSLVAHIRSGDSYALVLGLLLASLFFGTIAPEETWARILRDAVLAGTVVVAYWTATARRAALVPRVVVPSIALVLVVVAAVEGATTDVASAAIVIGLTAGLAFLVTRDLVDRRTVDVQTVCGALALYVLIGIFFASMYALVAEIGDGAFFARGDDGSTGERLYFSFVTISTTGYGDLAPGSGVGRAFAVMEIVVGQLYLVSVVAILVTAATRRLLASGADR